MCEVVMNADGVYRFISSEECDDAIADESMMNLHPTLYFSHKLAKQLFGYKKFPVLLCKDISFDTSEHLLDVYNIYDKSTTKPELKIHTYDAWRKFIKILLESPNKICIDNRIMIKHGTIYELRCVSKIIEYNGHECMSQIRKIYRSPYPKDSNYDTLKMLFDETVYKMTAEYKAIEAKTLGYFFGNMKHAYKNEALSDIKIR
jgi:hypothetical protein